MVNKIWALFFIIGIIVSVITGKLEGLNEVLLSSAKESLDMILKLFPIMALWLGITKIASVSGLLNKMSRMISPVLGKLFPEIPKGHASLSLITSNVIANFFGLGNAATPFGLKAMQKLQEMNPKKDTASRSMITFLVLNTSGLTLIPTTIISLRMMYDSKNPTEIVLGCILATACSTIAGMCMDRFLANRHRRRS